jgi:molybdate transport system ATP-binding protein
MGDLQVRLSLPRADFTLNVDLRLPGSGISVLFGPSGSGKTSVLRCVAGLEKARDARIVMGEEVWQDDAAGVFLPTHRRALGYVFQEASLFGHVDVQGNLDYGRKRSRSPAAGRTLQDVVDLLGIGHLLGRRVAQLSGGERQRVAIARALATMPRLLLLDEPLAALDAHTRAVVRDELADLLAELRLPAIVVTHDARDATALADRVGVLVDGEIRQLGPPSELLDAPADPFVAAFIGANVVHGLVDGAAVAVQPWAVRVVTAQPVADGAWVVAGTIDGVEREGPRARVRLGAVTADMPVQDAVELRRGQHAWATFAAPDAHVLRLR